MKKTFLTFITSVAISASLWAQAPQAFNYQGVARDLSGTALVAKNISVKASILDGSLTGTVVYAETHAIATNQFGLFTLSIGTGTVASGIFANTNWATGNKYLKIEIDPNGGSSYTLAGTTQLLSVPYAMYAAKAGDSNNQWATTATGLNYNKGDISIGNEMTDKSSWFKISKDNSDANRRALLTIENTYDGSTSNSGVHVTSGNGTNKAIVEMVAHAKSYFPALGYSGYGSVRSEKLDLWSMANTNTSDGFIVFRTGGNYASGIESKERVKIDHNGNVGIGTITPTATLHSNGTVRLQGLTSNNTLTNALVTDANGNVFTKDISTIGNSQWTDVTGGINYSGGRVGIGTTTPFSSINTSGVYPTTGWNGVHIKSSSGAAIKLIEGKTAARIHLATNDGAAGQNFVIENVSNSADGNSMLIFRSLTPNLLCNSVGMLIHPNGNIKIGGACDGSTTKLEIPKAKLQITSGDVYLDDATKGIIMKNTAGQCYRVTVGTAGALVSTLITCP